MCPTNILTNVALDDASTSGQTSTVGEPTVAVSGNNMFVTGNWFASRSTNGGATWQHVDPFTTLPSAAGGFCCDQIVLHDPRRGLWIWILQYIQQNNTNVFRLAAFRDADFGNPGAWYWWDIGPGTLDAAWSTLWFDYPDAAITEANLHVTFNLFNSANQWQRAVTMRFPLESIAQRQPLGFQYWSTTSNGSLRLTQGAGSIMYWADQNTLSQVRLFAWPDNQNSISWWDINVTAFSTNITSVAPNGVDWLSRTDQRITGACLAQGVITLAWTSGSGPNRPHAYCRVVQINEASKQRVGEPDIFSNDRAWAYPALCATRSGVLGVTAFHGGQDRHPGHVVGVQEPNGSWNTAYSRLGTHSPRDGKWGDYLSCKQDSADGNSLVASGYVLDGGDTRTDIIPRVVRFTHKP
ncbi:hypothetical protein [Kocuria arenosa]|uniref:hypothetical protein n=1 Tax=Kocuria arenosa TaxID=3071446 RepID=UPI0034D44524